MKKIIAILLALTLLLSFAACRKGSAEKSGNADKEYTTEIKNADDGTYKNYYDKHGKLMKTVFSNKGAGDMLSFICEYAYNDDGTRTETTTDYEDADFKKVYAKSIITYDESDRAIKNVLYTAENGKLSLTSTSAVSYSADGSYTETLIEENNEVYKKKTKTVSAADKTGKTKSYKIYSGKVLLEADNSSLREYYNSKGELICKIDYKGYNEESGKYSAFTVSDKSGKVVQKNGTYKTPTGEIFETE